MNYLGITGGGGPAPCDAGDASEGGRFTKPIKAWAHFPGKAPTTGVIEGVITDEDGNPFAGAIVTASGPKGATAVSGPGGLYYMTVDAGSYRVVPEDTSVKKSTATPTDRTVSVPRAAVPKPISRSTPGCRSPWTSALRRRPPVVSLSSKAPSPPPGTASPLPG